MVKVKRIKETGERVDWIIKLNGLIAPVKFAVLISSKYLTGYRLNKLIGLKSLRKHSKNLGDIN
jgi:hypothetical protein